MRMRSCFVRQPMHSASVSAYVATICSNVLLGGFVTVEDQAFLSGGVLVHQFGKVGRLCMVSGSTRVSAITVMKFESPSHRGRAWRCR